jgi:hypothetical protein
MTRYEALPELTRERMEGIWAQQQRPTPTVAESSKAVREIVFPLLDHLEGTVEAERARIVDDLRYGRKGMGDVVGPSIRNALADIIAAGGR